MSDISRMAETAFQTTAYANGQTVMAVVKNKDCDFTTREDLEEEVEALLKLQNFKCALTHHPFQRNEPNPHLRTSLDRIESSRGYISGNLQVVTRAANFFKSASDEDDWALKEKALIRMAISLQRKHKSAPSDAQKPPDLVSQISF
jgi:hypothetical protein